MGMNTKSELPKWKSHKTVEAFKIDQIEHHLVDIGEYEQISATLNGFGYSVDVNLRYTEKHKPQVGGYYVRYADGYESFSPAKAFEEGYTRVGSETPASGLSMVLADILFKNLKMLAPAFLKIKASEAAKVIDAINDSLSGTPFMFLLCAGGVEVVTRAQMAGIGKKMSNKPYGEYSETEIPRNNFEAWSPIRPEEPNVLFSPGKVFVKPTLGVIPENLWLECRITELARAIHDKVFQKRMAEINGRAMAEEDRLHEWAQELTRRLSDLRYLAARGTASRVTAAGAGGSMKAEVKP